MNAPSCLTQRVSPPGPPPGPTPPPPGCLAALQSRSLMMVRKWSTSSLLSTRNDRSLPSAPARTTPTCERAAKRAGISRRHALSITQLGKNTDTVWLDSVARHPPSVSLFPDPPVSVRLPGVISPACPPCVSPCQHPTSRSTLLLLAHCPLSYTPHGRARKAPQHTQESKSGMPTSSRLAPAFQPNALLRHANLPALLPPPGPPP